MAWNESFERVRARLHNRMYSYRAVFLRQAPDNEQLIDATPWWAVWRGPKGGEMTPPGDIVLRDLARYCYASRPTLKVSQVTQQSDAIAMAFAEGRRDVFNRIVAMLNLDTTQIERIAHARTIDE
jgi:hypothetical protein